MGRKKQILRLLNLYVRIVLVDPRASFMVRPCARTSHKIELSRLSSFCTILSGSRGKEYNPDLTRIIRANTMCLRSDYNGLYMVELICKN